MDISVFLKKNFSAIFYLFMHCENSLAPPPLILHIMLHILGNFSRQFYPQYNSKSAT